MIAIRLQWTRPAALACVLALATSGCGLSAELDRESNPERRPTPVQTHAAPPPVSATPGPSPSVPVQQAQGCPPSGLRFGTGLVNAAMGLRAMTLTLTNCGTRPYELNGYPSISVLDGEGALLTGVRTVQGTDKVFMAPDDPGPSPLTLAPGETARAGLYWRMAAEDGTYLRVAPEQGRDVTTVRLDDPLDIGPENTLGTTPWVPASAS
ncbi:MULTISPECIES: DUF4232 domain-containing protein [Streptomyces]|uniref:DUF4232 domain-containing protein n=1 Tax=Streptomyces dengpaensis TaxID=2049881 RepID=A0ABM6SM48_9ACTN|nr:MULTISPECIES: DUF4232 domain-containing protein [Streptomyces]AVH55515.1 DUF4232 domain-containing protein [Streptomyces dengpaensis]PIB11780.1 hypothetical protein B1C81_00660 [Streptomyces sp. HG99]